MWHGQGSVLSFPRPFSLECPIVQIFILQNKRPVLITSVVFAAKPTSRIVFGVPYISVCHIPCKCNAVVLNICFSWLLCIFISFYVHLYCYRLNSEHSEAAEFLVIHILYCIEYNIMHSFYAYLYSVTFAVHLPSHHLFIMPLSIPSHCNFIT